MKTLIHFGSKGSTTMNRHLSNDEDTWAMVKKNIYKVQLILIQRFQVKSNQLYQLYYLQIYKV